MDSKNRKERKAIIKSLQSRKIKSKNEKLVTSVINKGTMNENNETFKICVSNPGSKKKVKLIGFLNTLE